MMGKGISYGQKFFQNLMALRQLAQFSQTHFPGFSFAYVYNVAIGKFDFPSMKFIYDAMPFIPPDRWFYHVGEQFDFISDENAEYIKDYKQSANYRLLMEIPRTHGTYKAWCETMHLSYRSFMSIINGKRQLTPQRIFALRSVFPPAGWFVKPAPYL